MDKINEVITDYRIFSQFYILREGYPFRPLLYPPNIYNAIVIENPTDTQYGYSKVEHSLSEQITFVNKYRLDKAYLICDDLSFITQCPTLKHLCIEPVNNVAGNFDFSPLYDMPEIKSLQYRTEMGRDIPSPIDYSKISGLEYLNIFGKGHLNYCSISTLKSLNISGYKHEDLTKMFSSKVLDSLEIVQCKIKTLDGIQQSDKMQCLYLYYNRSLQDISALKYVKKTLKALHIENCPKIKDFSVLEELENLELLELFGSNELPDLNFVNKLKNLKTIDFSMNILDGNLSPCLELSYARCFRNRKHYNLKDKDLPKGHLVYGNEDIEEWRRIS